MTNLRLQITDYKLQITNLESVIWNLESVIWNLESVIWNLESVIRNLESGISDLESVIWNLESSRPNSDNYQGRLGLPAVARDAFFDVGVFDKIDSSRISRLSIIFRRIFSDPDEYDECFRVSGRAGGKETPIFRLNGADRSCRY
jgi:exonuclease VII small subunit